MAAYVHRVWPIESIRAWVLDLKTHEWIAQKIGCSNQHVSRLCRKHGIKAYHRGSREGELGTSWTGGRHIDKDGYAMVYAPDHPARRKWTPYVAEHRLVMERHLGRYLLPGEVVHHKNKNKADNRIENLELFQTNGAHLAAELAGHCPKWTPEGKAKILQAVQRRANRKRLERDGQASNQTTPPCPVSP